jgi:formylglycine-generating enzyme required for sulfatase activity
MLVVVRPLATAPQKTETGKPSNIAPENMVLLAGGTFKMGRSDLSSAEKPVHQVTVSSFYISKYELTQAEWLAVMGNNPCEHKCDNCPVENITWDDANDYCRAKSSKTGRVYRLPTEAEWEYAARGGNKSNGYIYSGINNIDDVGWFWNNSGGSATHPVGQKQPNELGLYDMTGNVWEWCSDYFDDNYYSNSPSQNPQGASTGFYRVIRGGGWADFSCPAAVRLNARYYDHNGSTGFRPVVSF